MITLPPSLGPNRDNGRARGRFRAGRPLFLRPRGFAAGLALRARRPLFVLGAPPYRGGLEIADHPGLTPPGFFLGVT